MSLSEIVLGWVGVSVWFLLAELALARLEGGAGGGARGGAGRDRWIRGPVSLYMGESLALTLLAALWFGSLGHGGWVFVFILIGVLTQLPLHFRTAHRSTSSARRLWLLAAGVGRIVMAGGLLVWILS